VAEEWVGQVSRDQRASQVLQVRQVWAEASDIPDLLASPEPLGSREQQARRDKSVLQVTQVLQVQQVLLAQRDIQV